MSWLDRVVSALAYSLCEAAAPQGEPRLGPPYNDAARFTATCLKRMPDGLSVGVKLLTLAFDLAGLKSGKRFHRQFPEARAAQIERWRRARLKPCRDLIKLHESLALFVLYGRLEGA